MVARTLSGRISAAALLLLVALCTSFSEPASHGSVLIVAPEARILAAARPAGPARPDVAGSISLTAKATAYNSLPGQTWGDPNVTATGSQTRFGIIAVSRDLLGSQLPYGSLVRLRDLGGFDGRGAGDFQTVLDEQQVFIVEDTMHSRKTQQVDVWFPELNTALSWGVRQIEVEVVRYGRDGPELTEQLAMLDALPHFRVSQRDPVLSSLR